MQLENTAVSEQFAKTAPSKVSRAQLAASVTPKFQELILLPTERCNLRCTYCYEDFKIGRMSAQTQRAIELLLERRTQGLQALRFSWFGGEPLMAKDIVIRLSRYAKKLCDERGVEFKGGLTTNAYHLDPQTFKELLAQNQDFYQITLDGWGAEHDEVRKFASGRGTFSRIWSNLLEMKKLDEQFEILLRIHVRRTNIKGLPVLISEAAKAFGDDPRFRLDFEHVRDLGGAGGATVIDGVSYEELGPIEQLLRDQYYRESESFHGAKVLPIKVDRMVAEQKFSDAKTSGESAGSQRLSDIAVDGPYICYASRPNSLLIRADGRIGKCTVALNDSRNDIGSLNNDGTLTINNDKLRSWVRGFESLDEETLGCPLAQLPQALSPDTYKKPLLEPTA